MENETRIENTSQWFDAAMVSEKQTPLSKFIFPLLLIIPIIATLAYGSVDAWAVGLLAIGSGLIAILWFIDAYLSRQIIFNNNPIQLPILGLIIIGLLQLIPFGNSPVSADMITAPVSNSISIAPFSTLLAVTLLVVFLIYFAAAQVFVNSQRRLRKTVFTLIIFGSFMAFLGVIQFLSGTDAIYGLRTTNGTLPFASYANKHHFAALMEMLIGLNLSLLYGEAIKKDKRFLLIMSAVLMGTVVVLTGSRGGMISLLGVIAFVTFFNFASKKSKSDSGSTNTAKNNNYLLIGGSVALVLVFFGSVLFLGEDQSLLRGTGVSGQAELTSGRKYFWIGALQVIKEHPIIGTGLDTFGFAFTKFDTWNGSMRVEQTHNDYLQILSDAGILGFICIVIFIYLLFKQSLGIISTISDRFRRGVVIGALAGCLGILIHSFFDFPLRTTSNAFVFLLLVAVATGTINYPKLYKRG